MPRGVPHSDEVRAAVMAALLQGQSIGQVADQHHMHKATVALWAAQLKATPLKSPPGADIGALVAAFLQTNLVTLEAQSRFFREPTWLREQSAADVAVLFGVIADKTFRLIAALEPAEPEESGEQPIPPA